MPGNSNTPSPSAPTGSGVDWDERYRRGDTPWDRGSAHPALLDWLSRHTVSGEVLVPGCGLGHDVRALAAAGARVTGLDLSATALAQARAFPVVGCENYHEGDFFRSPADWRGRFDGVFEHTCFCAIDPAWRTAYARSAADLLTPGGWLLAIFFLDPGVEQGPPFGCTPEELERTFAPFFSLRRLGGNLPTYVGRENEEELWLLTKRIPSSAPAEKAFISPPA